MEDVGFIFTPRRAPLMYDVHILAQSFLLSISRDLSRNFQFSTVEDLQYHDGTS